MKTKLTSQLHEYFMIVGDENYAEKSLTYLYVPIENLNGDVSELIGQIEGIKQAFKNNYCFINCQYLKRGSIKMV